MMLQKDKKLYLFLRVNYDKTNWEMISQSLLMDHRTIHRINRAQILDDSLTLARAGHLQYKV
jgi:aminopeptidase N